MAATRWGILSAGRISNDFCAAFHCHPPGEHEIVAVAARDKTRAKIFADRFNIPKCYGCYDDLMNDKDVDIIYIGTIHQYHRETCIKALDSGKHVLCETPMCMNSKEATEVVELAKKKNLFFMEGFYSRFFPVYEKLRQELKSSNIGDPQVITACIGLDYFFAESRKDVSSAGKLLGIGCYCIMLANMVFREEPEKIVATGGLTSPENTKALGSTSLETPSGGFEESLPEVPFEENYKNAAGLMYEQNHVRECLRKGLTESPIMPHSDSLQIMKILDEIRRQVGVVFDADM